MKKKQGYNARLDESLGARNKTKGKQSLKSRRKESEGMEKAKGRRKYAAVGTMDKGKKTAPVKKRRGGTAAPGTASRRAALARHQKRQNRFVRPQLSEGMKSGGTVKKTKQRGGMAARINKQAQLTTCEGMLKNETGEELAERTEARRKMERGGGRIAADSKGKQRGGRTAADSARAAARTHPRGSWATRLPRSLLKKGGRAPATTGVKLNMGAPKVKTITARGMGAALRGGQFRENT
jgi:hypothetical protein